MSVLAIVGPTASGKTALSIPVALRLGAEIISMDSRQVYRGMDVGTDKVDASARSRVPHHGLNLIDPDERYSAGRFARDARRSMAEIRSRGRLPLLVGGTGFFLRSLTDPVFREPPMQRERKGRLGAWLATRPREEMVRWVRRLDPDHARVAEAGGPQRLSRTLEVALLTGRPLSWWHRTAPPEHESIPVRTVLLELPAEELATRIDRRVEQMFRSGLLEEVRALLAAGFGPEDPGMSATGYREAAAVLREELSEEEAMERVRNLTRGYARRQRTWFRNQLGGDILRLDAGLPTGARIEHVVRWWEGTGEGEEGVPSPPLGEGGGQDLPSHDGNP